MQEREKKNLYEHTGRFIINMDTGELKLINGIDQETVEYDGASNFTSLYKEIKELADGEFLSADLPEKFKKRYQS